MTAYYNEFDPFAADWLEELIKDGLIAPGVVDRRSITEVEPNDLKEFTQCHFFAGIGGWSYAARLAGWSDDRPMWTGSPPCQPFSTAGNRKGKDDLRHLWPVFFNLIRECQPPTIFGEQVASAIRDGWFCDLHADLEAEEYASGMVVLPACSVGAPHKRDRLFYFAKCLADSNNSGQSTSDGRRKMRQQPEARNNARGCGTNGPLPNTERLDNTQYKGLERHAWDVNGSREQSPADRPDTSTSISVDWSDTYYPEFRDGKYRPVPIEPSLFPLAHGIPNRVGALRGAGNAIVPQVGAEVIRAFMEIER